MRLGLWLWLGLGLWVWEGLAIRDSRAGGRGVEIGSVAGKRAGCMCACEVGIGVGIVSVLETLEAGRESAKR